MGNDMNELRLKNLRRLISQYGTQANLVRTFDGLDASYISTLLKGRRSFGERAARNMEDRCHLERGWLDKDHDNEESLDNNVKPVCMHDGFVPLVSWVNAGDWREALDDREVYEHVPCPTKNHGRGTFALSVRGISMFAPGQERSFQEGDLIFVDPSREAINGDLIVAMRDDSYEATFKKLIIEDGKKFLLALNPEWRPHLQEIDRATTILGVVIAQQTNRSFY